VAEAQVADEADVLAGFVPVFLPEIAGVVESHRLVLIVVPGPVEDLKGQRHPQAELELPDTKIGLGVNGGVVRQVDLTVSQAHPDTVVLGHQFITANEVSQLTLDEMTTFRISSFFFSLFFNLFFSLFFSLFFFCFFSFFFYFFCFVVLFFLLFFLLFFGGGRLERRPGDSCRSRLTNRPACCSFSGGRNFGRFIGWRGDRSSLHLPTLSLVVHCRSRWTFLGTEIPFEIIRHLETTQIL